MAISVKDIQEKVFATQASNGYDVEQVDDFLDALADQLGSVYRENAALNKQIQQLQAALSAAKAETAAMEKKLPDYNENGYFRNLENAMRESLIGAQRIADETISEANKKADQTVADANAAAEKTVADANAAAEKTVADANAAAEKAVADASAKAEAITATAEKAVVEMKAESDRLHALADAYRANFKKLLDEQLAALNANANLLK